MRKNKEIEEIPKIRRKLGYCRVSTEEQTVEHQVVEMKKNGIAPVDIYRDEGVSGTVAPLKRDGFKKAYDLIMTGEVCELYIFEISRLGRNINESLRMFMDIEDAGCKVISMSPNEAWTHTQTDAMRTLMASMFAWFADIERHQTSERSKAAIRKARGEGKHIGRPFSKVLVKDEVRREYNKWKSQGMKTAQIARAMRLPQSTVYKYVKLWDEEDRIRHNEEA